MASTMAIVARKGGVGKTSTTLMFASILGSKGYKVLVIDLDSQHNTTQRLFNDEANEPQWRLYDLLEDEDRRISSAILPARSEYENVYYIEGDSRLAKAHQLLSDKISRESVLKEVLKPIKSKFDFIILDTPPAVDNLTVNALSAATEFLIPCDMSLDAFNGAKTILKLADQLRKKGHTKAKFLGTLVCGFEKANSKLAKQIKEILNTEYATQPIKSVIPATVKIAEAAVESLTPYQLFRNHQVTRAYEKVIDAIT